MTNHFANHISFCKIFAERGLWNRLGKILWLRHDVFRISFLVSLSTLQWLYMYYIWKKQQQINVHALMDCAIENVLYCARDVVDLTAFLLNCLFNLLCSISCNYKSSSFVMIFMHWVLFRLLSIILKSHWTWAIFASCKVDFSQNWCCCQRTVGISCVTFCKLRYNYTSF